MADKKISALTEGTALANDDLLVSVDVSDLTDAPTGTTKKITKANLVTDLESSLNHDSLTGFVANEHIDHSAVSITPNTGLVGGGDLTANRTISMDISTLTDTASPTATDEIAIDTAAGMRKSDLQAAVNAAGAVMNSDTSTVDMSFVVDEDNMASDSATKVPTQQSVKAYVDAEVGGAAPTYNCGQTSRLAASGTGTQNIAHGLGKTPSLIKINASGITSSNPTHTICKGNATSTTDETCTYDVVASVGVVGGTYQATNAIIYFLTATGTAACTATVSALDATNITLNFTTLASVDVYIQWEAFA